ncbi:protein TEX261-like [Gordionus sp. m RMFG-2023]|uniref:protein TEX261-like n=1 Tax=Gordionus sp. m RMFG-2023 TaxID=3053472 RepID=UPI0031FD3AC4
MLFWYLLNWITFFMYISFAALSLLITLYCIAEFIEENTILAAKIIRYLIFLTLFIHICFWIFEKDIPLTLIIAGIVSQINNLFILKGFPFINFLSINFIVAIIFVIINHYLAFAFFFHTNYPLFDVLTFFTFCEWLVPLVFMLSLSAGDYILPTTSSHAINSYYRTKGSDETNSFILGNVNNYDKISKPDVVTNYLNQKINKNGILSVFKYMKEKVLLPDHKAFAKKF